MSRSIHITIRNFRGLTKREIDEQADDPYSELAAWARKKNIKKQARILKADRLAGRRSSYEPNS